METAAQNRHSFQQEKEKEDALCRFQPNYLKIPFTTDFFPERKRKNKYEHLCSVGIFVQKNCSVKHCLATVGACCQKELGHFSTRAVTLLLIAPAKQTTMWLKLPETNYACMVRLTKRRG